MFIGVKNEVSLFSQNGARGRKWKPRRHALFGRGHVHLELTQYTRDPSRKNSSVYWLRTSTLVRHQTYVKERGTTKKRKSSRTYTKAKTRHLSDVLLQTAILFQEETTCLVSVCVFLKRQTGLIFEHERNLKKQEPKAARKIIKVNTPFDKRESKIKNDNRHDRRDYSHCCRGHFSSPPGGKRE